VKEIGPIDVLVNNAGIERTGSVEELALAECRALMETNYFGVIRCIQAVVPAMRQRRNGCIINVASVAGKIALSPLGAYAATKFALEALSEALAQEVKSSNIRVAIVEPGIIDTPLARHIGVAGTPSLYPQQRRNAALFAAVVSVAAHDLDDAWTFFYNPAPPGKPAAKKAAGCLGVLVGLVALVLEGTFRYRAGRSAAALASSCRTCPPPTSSTISASRKWRANTPPRRSSTSIAIC